MPSRLPIVAAVALVLVTARSAADPADLPAAASAAVPATGLAAAPITIPPTEPVYGAPVTPVVVVRPFVRPATRYGPGHRGVDLRAASGALIRSAGDGMVRFAGSVAGRGVVVVLHPDGISTEYEPVHPLVRPGAPVRRGQPVGELRGRHPGCAVACLHWGARRGEEYLDPLTLLRPLGPVVLLPWPRGD
jgi:murein DD-endopeptidase MepM/ murein hydrolase activator NlpD